MHPTLLFDRADRAIFEMEGSGAVDTLNGLVTNDVAALVPGDGAYAAILTAKGKIVADLYILRLSDRLLLSAAPAAAEGVRSTLLKFVNPRFAKWRALELRTVTAVGQGAAEWVARHTAVVQADVPSRFYAHVGNADSPEAARVVALPPTGVSRFPVYDVLVDASHATRLLEKTEHGAALASNGLLDTLRIEAGIPQWGADMNDTTLAGEANLDELHAVSYTKGCYVGQETVARVHFRGHVNRMLRRLVFAREPLPNATLMDEGGNAVGDVRSRAISPVLGAIGIGMVRREIESGATLSARWEGGGTEVTVGGKANGAIE